MRTILVGLILAIFINIGIFAAAKRYPDQANALANVVCGSPLGDWVCRPEMEGQAADAETVTDETATQAAEDMIENVEVVDDAGNSFTCSLKGCCSGKGGIDMLRLETGNVMCKNEEQSPGCSCMRMAHPPTEQTPEPETEAPEAPMEE